MRIALISALAALLLLPLQSVQASPADGVPWGDSTHRTKEELGAWLAQRGASYATWAERHPGAAARLEGQEVAPPETAPPESEVPVESPPVESPTVERPRVAATEPKDASPLGLVALVLAAVLLAVAALPRALVPGARPTVDRTWRTWRLMVAAGGMAVLVGWAVAVLGTG